MITVAISGREARGIHGTVGGHRGVGARGGGGHRGVLRPASAQHNDKAQRPAA
jgi:hypothetical protein